MFLLQVHWLTLHSAPRAANFYGTAISQCAASPATYDVANLNNANFVYDNDGNDPLWNAGLRVRVTGFIRTLFETDHCKKPRVELDLCFDGAFDAISNMQIDRDVPCCSGSSASPLHLTAAT